MNNKLPIFKMKMRKLSLLLLLGLGSAGRAFAQLATTAPDTTPPRWLVGAQLGYYPRVIEGGDGLARPWPVQLIGRYQTGRAGAEAGLLLRADPARLDQYIDQYGTTTSTARSRAWLLTLAGRYQLAPRQPARWRLDAALGLMVVSTRAEHTTTYTDARTGQQSASGSSSSAYNDLPLLGGLGFTYQLTPRVALTADARTGWSYLGTALVRVFGNTNFVAPLWPVCGVGASYSIP